MKYIVLFLVLLAIPYLSKKIKRDNLKKWLGIKSPSKHMIYVYTGHASKDGDKNES